jgi:hypothetical protein
MSSPEADKLQIIRNLLKHGGTLPDDELLQRISGVLRSGDDSTRQARIALDACQEYFRLSREHWTTGNRDDATVFAVQGILRALIFFIEFELESQ